MKKSYFLKYNSLQYTSDMLTTRFPSSITKLKQTTPIHSRLNVVVRSPIPFGLSQNGCWPSQGSHSPQALGQTIFLPCCPLNDLRSAARSFFKISLFSLFSCLSPAFLRLLILLLLLMSGNVYPNPGPVFPCSVCAGKVT